MIKKMNRCPRDKLVKEFGIGKIVDLTTPDHVRRPDVALVVFVHHMHAHDVKLAALLAAAVLPISWLLIIEA